MLSGADPKTKQLPPRDEPGYAKDYRRSWLLGMLQNSAKSVPVSLAPVVFGCWLCRNPPVLTQKCKPIIRLIIQPRIKSAIQPAIQPSIKPTM